RGHGGAVLVAAAISVAVTLMLAALLLVRRGRPPAPPEGAPEAPRMIPPDVQAAVEEADSRRRGVAVCLGSEAYRTRRGLRGPFRHPRPLLPVEGRPGAARERHRRAWHAGHGHG